MSATAFSNRRRGVLLGVLGPVVILGLGSRKFADRLPEFVALNAGDALWTVAVYLTLALTFPRWRPLRIGLFAFAISVAVEFSQLVDIEWLNTLRRTSLGRLLLGAGFLWVDLFRYLAGAALATTFDWLWTRDRQKVPA